MNLDERQRQAVDVPFDVSLAIAGAAGSGKTVALRSRIERAQAAHPDSAPLVASGRGAMAELAWSILREDGCDGIPVDDVDAELLFAQAAMPLFALEWDEFEAAQIDPEVPSLRSPERFLEAAFRLIRKLRDAVITPSAFLDMARSGGATFYAKPPNFAHHDLIFDTKDTYRDSLVVTPEELQRQYRREIDLAKILAGLYARYLELITSTGRMTSSDAIALAFEAATARPELAESARRRARFAFIDDAHDLTTGEVRILQAVFGKDLAGVTLALDLDSATATFRGARPEAVFAAAAHRIELTESHRAPVKPVLSLYRAKTIAQEAEYIADAVARLRVSGTPPAEIALIFRSVADVDEYARALIERDVPVEIGGDANIFRDRFTLDALALLWNTWNPFAHEWMLRTLANPALALSDASVAALCSEPASPQTALFSLDEENAPTVRASRWDPKRDVRLGWNVIRGDQDAVLGDVARERVRRFRALRLSWVEALATLPFSRFLERVWSEGLAREGAPGSAKALAQELALARLSARLHSFRLRAPEATLGDTLAYAQSRANSDLEACESAGDDRFVRILSVDAARGREFEHVFVPDARAGAFPRWYVPDAFLFSPSIGMVPRENVGEAQASRTAKFTYYLHRSKTRDRYNAEERRAFNYAMRRAKRSVTVTASGRATRGITAPEFFEELKGTAGSAP